MRLPSKMAMLLFEAAEQTGVTREELCTPLGLTPARLTAPRGELEWDTLVAVLDQLSIRLDGDVEKMRAVGRKMVTAPSFSFLKDIARTLISLQSLYLVGERWVAPASVPHLLLRTTFPAEDRLHFRCMIPELYAASAPYLHIFEGLLVELPSMLGLLPARIVRTTVTPRTLDIVLDLPRSRSLFGRLGRRVHALRHRRAASDLLEGQRLQLERGLELAGSSTREIQTLLERLPILVLILREGTILWASPAVIRLLGFEKLEQVVGATIFDFLPPDLHAQVESRMHVDPSSARMPDLFEGKLVNRDGATVSVEVSRTQAVTYGGKPARLLVARDITERTRLREQVLISERLASIGMLAAGVAHEVNNPLAYVLNNIEMARRELASLGDAGRTSRAALSSALEGVDRIRTVVRDLLALSRVDDHDVGPIDAAAVVESTLALASHRIAERAELERDYREVPLVRGTAARLGQILLNLLANALDAMPKAMRSTNRLRIALYPSPSGGAVVEVSDNGVGIAPENVERIFEPFFTTKSLRESNGLGLAISKRLAAELGGELSFESVSQRGATFRLVLAAAQHDVDDAGAAGAPAPRPG
jgi:PAS domain S-box-containing protein